MKIDAFGDRRWKDAAGNLHREGGAAVEYADGTKYWYRNGKLHREDGAAVEFEDGYREYWYGGERYIEIRDDHEWGRLVRLLVLR